MDEKARRRFEQMYQEYEGIPSADLPMDIIFL